ncbi:MAG: hypothetical protein ABIW76_14475, partial [Fibrobacteria bacterium]
MATATDSFGGSGALTTGWTIDRAGLSQASGVLVSTSTYGLAKRSDISPGPEQYVQGKWVNSSAAIFNGKQFLMLRYQDTDNHVYVDFDDGRHAIDVYFRIGGANGSIIYSIANATDFLAGDTIKVTISSAHLITIYLNGTSIGSYDASATISTLTTGSVGIGMSGATTDQGAWD